MKRKITKIIACLMTVFLIPVLSLSANSAMTYWNGSDGTGVVSTDEECPIIAEHETLTFTLSDSGNGTDRFAAEYTFRNPSDMHISAALAFPFGSRPAYGSGTGGYDDESLYHVLVNGEEIEPQLRYTWTSGYFQLERDLPRLRDSYMEDSFYRPDLPVYRYKLHFSVDDEGKLAEGLYIDARNDVRNEPERIRWLIEEKLSGYGQTEKETYFQIILNQAEEDAVLYTFGSEAEFAFTYQTTESKPTELKGTCTVIEKEEMTYEQFVMANKPADFEISDVDHYNAMTEMLRETASFDLFLTGLYNYPGGLMKWFAYTLEFEPGETLTNTVQAPSYPYIDTGYDESVYEYRYLLSPASTWKEFKGLDIIVSSSFEMLKSAPEGFTKTDTGYEAHFDSLPEGELSFTMCSIPNPKRQSQGSIITAVIIFYLLVLLALIAGFIWLIAKLIKWIFRKHV